MTRSAVSPPGHPYLAHWGLVEAPFLLDPDLRFRFEGDDHREGLARLLFGLTQLGGIVMVTGEIGAGKTLLAATLLDTLAGGDVVIATVGNPPRSPAALLAALALALDGDPRGGTAARMAGRIRARVGEEADAGRRVVLMVDEAQRLDPRALDEVRMLTNPGEGPSAAVVLLGQPELTARVNRLPQVAQRVVVRHHLGPMDAAEVDAYVTHRTRVAGAPRRIFSERATRAVHAESEGVPRLVNLLCANALFVGYARGEDVIGADTVHDLAEDRRRMDAGE
ncbi:MAG: AAA family ATPase [Thermoleophilia bacterium]|nr:AAA family ATPase [Thermoleophilia bacterium]